MKLFKTFLIVFGLLFFVGQAFSMDIVVKIETDKGNGETFTLKNVDLSDTIENVKDRIHDEQQIPCDKQKLIYDGQVLYDDDSSLADNGVKEGSTLHLIIDN